MSTAGVPAAFLRRCIAWSIDAAIITVATVALCWTRIDAGLARTTGAFDAVIASMARSMADLLQGATPMELARQWLADPAQRALVEALSDAIGATLWPPLLVFALLAFAWFTGFEASAQRATPGKRVLGLHVATADGSPLRLVRAAQRNLAGTLSWLTLNIGHLLAAIPPQRLALHDRIAGTRVLQHADAGALPAWATLWLGVLALAGIGAMAWLFVATNAAMNRAFDALL